MIYLELLWSFLQIGLFSIGGGYAAVPLIQNQAVNGYGWLTMEEFTDLITIAEMTPGPIAVNSATFVGIRVAGIGGALIATFGCILPSCIIVSLLALLYRKYGSLAPLQTILSTLRPAIIALIASAGVSILCQSLWSGSTADLPATDIIAAVLIVGGLFVLRKWKPNPIFVMLGCGILGGSAYLLTTG